MLLLLLPPPPQLRLGFSNSLPSVVAAGVPRRCERAASCCYWFCFFNSSLLFSRAVCSTSFFLCVCVCVRVSVRASNRGDPLLILADLGCERELGPRF